MNWKINLFRFSPSFVAIAVSLFLSSSALAVGERELDPSKEWVRAPQWGASWPTSPRVTLRWPAGLPGLPYRIEMRIDGKPFDSLPIQESSGAADPYVHVLAVDLIAYLGCGEYIDPQHNNDCDSAWRVLRPSKKSSSPIRTPNFVSRLGEPNFLSSYMGYAVRLPNGNSGCVVYDWTTEKSVVRWDSGSVAESVSVRFHQDGGSVTCQQITGWKPNPNYLGGEVPQRFPVLGKEFTQRLPDKERRR